MKTNLLTIVDIGASENGVRAGRCHIRVRDILGQSGRKNLESRGTSSIWRQHFQLVLLFLSFAFFKDQPSIT